MESSTVDVILPVLNEVGALQHVIDSMPEGFRPLVVDNGSTDGSVQLAERLGVRVVHEKVKGFGAAVHAGVVASTSEVIAVMDADATLDPQELPKMLKRILANDTDLIMGKRVADKKAWGLVGRLGNKVVTWQLRKTSGVQVYDIGPMRMVHRQKLLDLNLTDRRYGYPLEMVVKGAKNGWKIEEVNIHYAKRNTGKSKVTGNALGVIKTVKDMTKILRDM